MNQVIIVLFLGFIASGLAVPNVHNGGRIIGGDDAKEAQFPYIVSLRIDADQFHFCAGSIIAPNVVLTAGHCLDSQKASEMAVVAGALKKTQSGDKYPVEKIIIHEEFVNDIPILNDIALIILAENITLSDDVAIVKLREVDDEKEECVLSGWGETFLPENTDTLQFVNLLTTTRQECSDQWSSVKIYDYNICTLTKIGEGACFGDSGGPLVDSNGYQIGIVSWGNPCAEGQPDIFTRVAYYSDWIKKNANLD